jgi:hypothetical protein
MQIGEATAVAEPVVATPTLDVAFADHDIRCGDDVRIRARASRIPNGTAVAFTVSQQGRDVASLQGTLSGSSAQATWRSQAQTDQRPEPDFEASASAAGTSARDAQVLRLRKYDDLPSQTRTFPRASGIYQWTGRFDIRLREGQIVVTTKIKLVNRLGPKPAPGTALPAIGPPVSDADKARMKRDIEGKLSNKHFFHRQRCRRANACDCPRTRGCCKIRVRVVVRFVESGQHHDVNLFQGAGQANATNWTRVKTRANSYAHETGHLLGWFDEYAAGAVGPAPRWTVQSGVVMNTGLRVPAEYYWDFSDWLAGRVHEPWSVQRV